jgi:hypothetical protein
MILDYQQGMTLPDTCIVRDMPNEAYHATHHLSKSKLDLFNRSPAHLDCAKPKDATRNMEIGTAIHTAILEPERFKAEYLLLTDAPDRRSSLYKEATKVHSTERVLVSSEVEQVQGMQVTALAHQSYKKQYLEKPHENELSFFGICSITGAPIKCRFDMLTQDGRALDLKKTQDIRDTSRSLLNYRYHVQHAFYSHVYECVTGDKLQSFAFFFIEQETPHSCVIANLCEETKQAGHKEMLADLEYYASKPNPTTGIWNDDTIISLPEWYLNRLATEEISYE